MIGHRRVDARRCGHRALPELVERDGDEVDEFIRGRERIARLEQDASDRRRGVTADRSFGNRRGYGVAAAVENGDGRAVGVERHL